MRAGIKAVFIMGVQMGNGIKDRSWEKDGMESGTFLKFKMILHDFKTDLFSR